MILSWLRVDKPRNTCCEAFYEMIRMQNFRSILAVVSLLLLQSCEGILDETDCTDIAIAGIVVRIPDPDQSVDSATITAQENDFVDEYRFVIGEGDWVERLDVYEIGLAVERAGTYDVTVESPGFNKWEIENVEVDSDRCHVETVTLDVNLVHDGVNIFSLMSL